GSCRDAIDVALLTEHREDLGSSLVVHGDPEIAELSLRPRLVAGRDEDLANTLTSEPVLLAHLVQRVSLVVPLEHRPGPLRVEGTPRAGDAWPVRDRPTSPSSLRGASAGPGTTGTNLVQQVAHGLDDEVLRIAEGRCRQPNEQ